MTPQNNIGKKPAAPHSLPVFNDQKVETHTMQQDLEKTKPNINPETEKIDSNITKIPTPPKPPTQEIPLIKGSLKLPEDSPEIKKSPFDRFRKPKEKNEAIENISKFKEMLPKANLKDSDKNQTIQTKNKPREELPKNQEILTEKEKQIPNNKNNLEIKIPTEKNKLPIFIIMVASFVVLITGAALWYYLFFVKNDIQNNPQAELNNQPDIIKIPEPKPQEIIPKTPEPKIPETKEIPEPKVPNSFIFFDQTIITSADKQVASKFLENLKTDSAQISGRSTITRHLFKVSNSNEKRFIPTLNFLKTITVFIPNDISSEISSAEFISYKLDSKIRYGIIATISNKERVLTKMKNWEGRIISDLKQLYMGESIIVPENPKFSENEYLNFTKRYINLTNTDLSLDYAVSDKFLIIATSKDMMFASILQTQK